MLIETLKARWNAPNGYRRVLDISLPLVASMGSTTLMLYTDRIFLGHFSIDALAAATPAGMTAFMFIAFFLGTATYANTFVAQYVGSGQPRRVGAALWQTVYFSLVAGVLLAGVALLGRPLFRLGGHELSVQRLEVVYFRVLLFGAVFGLLRDSMTCFYSGRGLTRTIMVVNLLGTAINIPLDYVLINGVWIFPRLGILGAGLATIAGHLLMVVMLAGLLFSPEHNRRFGVWSNRAFDRDLFARLLRFGMPAGVQFFLDIFAFALFLFLVGRLGKVALAATNIAFATNMLAFLPMIGFSIATSTLVGHAIGANQPEESIEAVRSALHLTLIYMVLVAAVFLLLPSPLVNLFKPSRQSPGLFEPIHNASVILLRFVAVYTLFDALTLIYSAAIKGAGDTRFVGWTVAISSLLVLILPVYIAQRFFHAGLYVCWGFAALYVCVNSLIFRWRFRQGHWMKLRVIETHPAPMPQHVEIPTPE